MLVKGMGIEPSAVVQILSRWSLALFVVFISYAQTVAKPLLTEDFESVTKNSFAAALLERPRMEIVPGEGVDGSAALKAIYEGYERGSKRLLRGYVLPETTEATLLFDVRFDQDFQFVRGGKLHGFGPDKPVTGGEETRANGWSARLNFRKDGKISTYVYEQDKESKWGIAKESKDFRFEKERFYNVAMYLRLNSEPDSTDGLIRVYVDGEKVIEHAGLRLRGETGKGTGITRLLFSTFHGGSTESYAPRNEDGTYATVHAYFDNFAVFEGERISKD